VVEQFKDSIELFQRQQRGGNMNIRNIVSQASKLQNEINDRQANLDELKTIIRAHAKKDSPNGDKISYTGGDGSLAEVVFVADKSKIKNGVNLTIVKREIGDEHYAHLFQEKVTVTLYSDFDKAFALLPSAIRQKLARVIETVSSEPRVSIK
jgi:hypothetical protein